MLRVREFRSDVQLLVTFFSFSFQLVPAQHAPFSLLSSRSDQGSEISGQLEKDSGSLHSQALLRHPIALALDESGHRLLVANRRSGTLSVIDTSKLVVVFETRLGRSLADLTLVPGHEPTETELLALDEEAHTLLMLTLSGPVRRAIQVKDRLTVSRYPVSVSLSGDGKRCFVSCLWSRRLDVIGLDSAGGLRLLASLELPFSPREQEILPGDDQLVVADAFGGKLALVDLSRNQIERVMELPAHNIRGLAVTSDGTHLLVSRQSLDPHARASRDDVVWGGLISNSLASLRLANLLSPRANLQAGLRNLDLGDFSTPSGDPQKVIVAKTGEVIVSIGGVGRVAIGEHTWPRLDHVRVRRRPGALAVGTDGRLYVANRLSNSISVIEIRSRKVIGEVELGVEPDLTKADEGERLFYDAKLSLRGWMSCHSCHSEGHSNGLLVDTLGDGNYGAPKRVPSLLGVGGSGPWAWNGSMSKLEDQVDKSLRTTLHSRGISEEKVQALTTYLQTLEPPRMPVSGSPKSIQKGRELFHARGCQHCHAPPSYTTEQTADVGLFDAVGNRRFNPPSLRGVGLRSSFFHDGRAKSLRDVFEVHGHPGELIPAGDVTDLIVFLSTL